MQADKARAFSRDKRMSDERGACHRGGRRLGACRNKGYYGKSGEATVVMHIPMSQVEQVIALLKNSKPIEMI